MSRDSTKMVQAPLPQYTSEKLRARAAELRNMAATARSAADTQALVALGERFDALAARREAANIQAHSSMGAQAPGLTVAPPLGAADRTGGLNPEMSTGTPSPEALAMAAGALGRHFILPETRQHPVIESATIRLASLLMVYDLVARKPAAQADTTEKPRSADMIDQRHEAERHILLVDDVADVLVSVGAFLANAGFAVRRAGSGDEALAMIANEPQIEILVTDFAMPGLNGVDLIAQATQVRPNLKALVITGYPNADGLAELPPHAIVLTKPFRRDSLITAVKSLLGDMRPVSNETADLSNRE